jgi:hypothetical protein
LSTGRAVIAWYDAENRQLVYSYSSDTAPTSDKTNNWQVNAKVIDDDFAGWHVDLAVDGADGIHLAYYSSSNGDLRYAYIPAYDSELEDIKVVTVDSYLSPGTKLMINVREELVNSTSRYVPYISYYHASFSATTNPVRVAWQKTWNAGLPENGADNTDKYTGDWEVMTVPTQNIPVEDFICNGVPTSGAYEGTIFLAYMTDAYYERAYLKKQEPD